MRFALSFILICIFLTSQAQDRVDSISSFFTVLPSVSAQVGLIGTNPEHVLEPVAVLRVRRDGINTTFGKGKDGVLFDFSVTQPIMDGLTYNLATRNHGWASHGYFNDFKASLNHNQTIKLSGINIYTLRSQAFYGFANQQLNGNLVSGPRIGLTVTNELTHDANGLGKFKLVNRNKLSYYPQTSDVQYAIRFMPSWTITFFENRFVGSYDLQFANAASPFDGNVDRLGDVNKFNLVWHYEPEVFLSGTLKNTFGFAVNICKDIEKNQSPLRSAYWKLDARQVIDALVWELRLELQAAALLAPVEDKDLRASLILDNDIYFNDWRYHFKTEYKFVHPDDEDDIELFELGLGPVIELDGQKFRPYLAFNLAEPLFNAAALDQIAVSAFGFEVLQ